MSNRRLLFRAIGLSVVVVLLAGCGTAQIGPPATPTTVSPTVTPTPISPTVTPTPIPPTPTPAAVLKLEFEEGKGVTFGGGTPFFIPSFDAEGNAAGGFQAVIKSSKFDLSSMSGKNSLIIAFQLADSGEITHDVFVDIRNLGSFYVSEDYIVFPQDIPSVQENGPFIELIFHHGEPSSEPLDGWDVVVEQQGRTESGKLTSSGAFKLSNVAFAPIHCTLTDPSSSETYEYVAFPSIRGASEGLVAYRIWNITAP